MAYDIGLKIGIDGEAEFRKSISNINEEYKTLKTEMATVTSAFDKNDQSQEKLTKQNEVLTKQIDLQKKKIEECNSALEKAKDKYGDNDRVTQSWQRAVNTATTELNKLERGLETNNTALATHNSKLKDLSNASNDAKEKIGAMGDGMASAGSKMTAGITVPAAAAIAGLSALVMKSVGTADEMQRLSDVTGISAEELQKLNYAGSALGVELTTITGAQAKLTKSMAGATDGTGTQAEAFATLGVSILDSNGNMRDANTVMMESFDALSGVGNETERDALAMAIFGKSAMELNPLIKAGSAGLKELTDEAEANGSVISNEGVAALDTFGDSLDAMGLSIMGAVGSVAADFTPTLQELANVAKDDIVPAIAGIVKGAGDLIVGFTELDPTLQKVILGTAGIALAAGPVMSVVGNVTSVVGGAVGAFGTLSGAIGVMTTGAVAATPAIAGTATALTVLTGPIGIVVGALALLTAGGFALHEVMTKGKQLTEEQIKANDAFVASSTAVAGAVTANIASRSDSIKTSQDEAMAAQELSVKLFDLADKQNKSGAEMQLLASYVDQFNQLMPNANLLIDEQTGALNLTRDATNELIAAETERIQKQAVNEALVQNAKDQLATKRELNEATIRQTQLEQEYAQGLQAVIDGTGNASEKQQKANELWAKYQEQLGPVNESIATLTAKQGDLNNETAELNKLNADPSGWNAFINGSNTASQAVVTLADGSIKKIQEFGTTAPILMAQTGTNTTTAFQNSLTSGIPGVNTAAQAVHDTVKTTTDPLVPELAKTGDDGAHGLGQSILNQQPWIQTNSQLIHDTTKNTTDPLVPELTTTGNDSGYGLGTALGSQNPYVGINAKLIHDTTKTTTDPLVPELTTTGNDSGQGLGQALGNQNEWVGINSSLIHDTTKNTTDPLVSELSTTGNDAGYGLGDKLGSNEEHVKTKAGLLYNAADGKISPLPGVVTGYGGDTGQGLINGMDGKKEEVGTTADGLVQKVLTVFKKGFGINSPAKETYAIGAFTMEGFLNSLIDGSVNVMGFLDKMIADIKNAFANGNFNLKAAINFVGSGAAEFFKSIGIGGSDYGSLVAPVSGSITSGFGYRDDVPDYASSYHQGIDIGAAEGTPVGAAGAGAVTQAGWNGGYGNSVTIDHGNGLETLYGHLSEILVSVGDVVSQLQTIGLVGSTGNSTGPHLHFSVIQNGEFVDPSSIFGFDVGSRYIPRDMVAMIHEGEMIVPKKENPYANSGGQIIPGGGAKIEQTVNIYSPTALSPAQTARLNKRAMQELALSF